MIPLAVLSSFKRQVFVQRDLERISVGEVCVRSYCGFENKEVWASLCSPFTAVTKQLREHNKRFPGILCFEKVIVYVHCSRKYLEDTVRMIVKCIGKPANQRHAKKKVLISATIHHYIDTLAPIPFP